MFPNMHPRSSVCWNNSYQAKAQAFLPMGPELVSARLPSRYNAHRTFSDPSLIATRTEHVPNDVLPCGKRFTKPGSKFARTRYQNIVSSVVGISVFETASRSSPSRFQVLSLSRHDHV